MGILKQTIMYHAVMIIDDCELQRYITETMVKRSLSAEQVMSFNSPMAALIHLRSLAIYSDVFPDVIFLDIHMPEMDGFDFLDRFLEFPVHLREDCKVVMLSSSDAAEDHERMRAYPVIRRFLKKPMSREMFNDISILWKNSKNEPELLMK
jgi:CheY-like chemotaxis protein